MAVSRGRTPVRKSGLRTSRKGKITRGGVGRQINARGK